MEVSVIIPIYNEELYLDRCIHSVLDQPEVAEIILVDDHSTDKSMEICRKWERENSKIRVLTNEGIKGAGGARNTGIRKAQFDYIAFLDADDYYLKNRFKGDKELFNSHPELEAIAHSVRTITIDMKDEESLNSHYKSEQIIGNLPSFETIDLWSKAAKSINLHIDGFIFKRSVFGTIGYFDESLKQAQDSDLILRMLISCKVMTGDYNKPVAVYYRHAHNTTRNLTEAVYYRRMKAKKHFHLSLEHRLPRERILKSFMDFIEYDYLWIFKKNHPLKKLIKLLILPYTILRIMSKNDPVYNKDDFFK